MFLFVERSIVTSQGIQKRLHLCHFLTAWVLTLRYRSSALNKQLICNFSSTFAYVTTIPASWHDLSTWSKRNKNCYAVCRGSRWKKGLLQRLAWQTLHTTTNFTSSSVLLKVVSSVLRNAFMSAGISLKNGVFWDVTPCGSYKNRRFGGTWRLLHQSDKNPWTRNNTSCN
jgi:hypothetical protein